MHILGYWLNFLAPTLAFYGAYGGNAFYAWVVGLTFIAVPTLDIILGEDTLNPAPEEEASLLKDKRYSWVLYGFSTMQAVLLVWGCYLAGHAQLLSLEWLGLLGAIGLVNGGLSINMAHELCHRNTPLEQFLSKLLWFRVGYMHFHIEHRLGHHINLGTPNDPATARLGESLYAFYIRSWVGTYRNAWKIERERLQRKGSGMLSWRNQMLWFGGLPLSFALIVGSLWGWKAALFYGVQCAFAIVALETINYLEHYGLARKQLPNGDYEKIGINHSWNTSRWVTNFFLLKLQRHSDHHVNPHRKYQVLRHFEDSPQLPFGYAEMFVMAFFPPIWRRVMDKRALQYREPEESFEDLKVA